MGLLFVDEVIQVCKKGNNSGLFSSIFFTAIYYISERPGLVAQSVLSPTADPGVPNSARSNTFVEIDREIISSAILLLGLLSVTSKSMCTKYWLTAWSSLPRKKCGKVNWPSQHDHCCWLGRKTSNQTEQKKMNFNYAILFNGLFI